MKLLNAISIIIPTYNREKNLKEQLTRLLGQTDIFHIYEVLIIDNNSNYDIYSLVNEFNFNKIKIVKNPFNLYSCANVSNAFYYCKTQWFWLLSDDDIVEPNAISVILNEISKCSALTGLIKFSKTNSIQKRGIVNNLDSFIDYYYTQKPIRSGDLVFISTNVYNLELLSKYLGYCFQFSYSYIPHLIPIIKALENKSVEVVFSDEPIVKYLPPIGDNYSFAEVGKGLSTLSHLPIYISSPYRKKFFKIFMSITPMSYILWLIKNYSNENLHSFKIIYDNIYKYYLGPFSKLFIKFLQYSLTNKYFRIIFIQSYFIYAVIKRKMGNKN